MPIALIDRVTDRAVIAINDGGASATSMEVGL